MFWNYIQIALYMMRARLVRSALSLLGIYIGVLALVMILSIQEGNRREMSALFDTDGARVVMVFAGFNQETQKIGHLSMDELQDLASEKDILSVMPHLTQDAEIRSAGATVHGHVVGIDSVFVPLYRVPVPQGRTFLPDEVDRRQPVCLLTETAAHDLFPVGDPLKGRVNLLGTEFQVIGVVKWAGLLTQRTMMEDPSVLVPYRWILQSAHMAIPNAEVRLRSDLPMEAVNQTILQSISHHDAERAKSYLVMSVEKLFQRQRESKAQPGRSLLAIAAISLLVGGIGIANVMLTSVTERIREIGLRKALGARRRDILMQFLVESSVLTVTGGLLAEASGWIIINLVPALLKNAPNWVFPGPVAAACLCLTVLIGFIAGLYPASRAAALSPVEALRYE